jgi:hypothetical protein
MMLKKILFTIIIFTTTQVQAREIILAEKGYVDDLATKRVRPSEMAAAITAALTSYTTKTYVDNLVSSIATLTTAEKLNTARTVQTNLASTTAASFNGTANITPGVTGVLPVANGGTGSSQKISLICQARRQSPGSRHFPACHLFPEFCQSPTAVRAAVQKISLIYQTRRQSAGSRHFPVCLSFLPYPLLRPMPVPARQSL